MNKKPFIIIGGLLLFGLGIIVICVIGAALYHRSNKSARYSAGREFGRTTDQLGCRRESLRLISADAPNTFLERYKKTLVGNFTQGCLQTCKATNEFCYDVPRPEDLSERLEYVDRRCDSGLPGCSGVYSAIVRECGRKPLEEVSYPK